jgi:hypothetical protein
MTEPGITEPRKGLNLELGRTSNDRASNGTEPRMTEPRMRLNLENGEINLI